MSAPAHAAPEEGQSRVAPPENVPVPPDAAEESPGTEVLALPHPPSVRVTVLAGRDWVPLVIPSEAPLSKLIDPVVKAVNRRLVRQGSPKLPGRTKYEFAWPDRTQLSSKDGATLSSSGVKDGELLQLVKHGSALRYVARNENMGSALSNYLRALVKPVTAATAQSVGVTALIAAIGGVGVLIWRHRMAVQTGWGAMAALGVLALLCWAASAAIGVRWASHVRMRDAFTATSIALTAGVLAALPAGMGVANVFGALSTLTVGAGVMTQMTRRYIAAGTAIICVGALASVAAFVSMFAPLSAFQVGVSGITLLLPMISWGPKLTLMLARIPRQPYRSVRNRDMYARAEGQPYDTVSPVEDEKPDPTVLSTEQIAEVGNRSRLVLVGICLAVAIVQTICGWWAIVPHQNRPGWSVALVVLVALVVIIRARKFNDRVQAVLLVASSALALMGIGFKYAWATPATDLIPILIYCGASVAAGLVLCLIGTAGWQHLASPSTRMWIQRLSYVMGALVVPVAAYVLNIFTYFRTQGIGWWF